MRLLSFALLLLSLGPLSQAQTNRPSGTIVRWGNGWFLPYVEPGARFTAIAAGSIHTLALTSYGSVVTWGLTASFPIAAVPAHAQSGVVAIAAGGQFTVALKSNGSVAAWGENTYGQSTVPVTAQSGVVAIAA